MNYIQENSCIFHCDCKNKQRASSNEEQIYSQKTISNQKMFVHQDLVEVVKRRIYKYKFCSAKKTQQERMSSSSIKNVTIAS
ncbi:unnamed protein product [Amoebophrya sp. A25]|nr:unnamed protein product [Amoebophrya sp. A25]|eukprot:GSA25T00007247001.1